MNFNQLAKRIGYWYLVAVPFLTALIGFGIGHGNYRVYLPVWMLSCCMMASYLLGIELLRRAGRRIGI